MKLIQSFFLTRWLSQWVAHHSGPHSAGADLAWTPHSRQSQASVHLPIGQGLLWLWLGWGIFLWSVLVQHPLPLWQQGLGLGLWIGGGIWTYGAIVRPLAILASGLAQLKDHTPQQHAPIAHSPASADSAPPTSVPIHPVGFLVTSPRITSASNPAVSHVRSISLGHVTPTAPKDHALPTPNPPVHYDSSVQTQSVASVTTTAGTVVVDHLRQLPQWLNLLTHPVQPLQDLNSPFPRFIPQELETLRTVWAHLSWTGSIWPDTAWAEPEPPPGPPHHGHSAAPTLNPTQQQFLAYMSHELRAPLNAILGLTQVLAESSLETDQRHQVKLIDKSGHYLLELINHTLDLAKLEAGQAQLHYTRFNLHELLRDVVNLFQLQIQSKGLVFQEHWLTPLPRYVESDPLKIRQILTNIISNAIKFTDSGQIVLSLALMQANPGDPSAGCLWFSVQDTGVGIDGHELETLLFQPFGQTESGRKSGLGTGLGLNLSRQNAKLLGGNIVAVSQPNQGSTFSVEVQVKVPPQAETGATPTLTPVQPVIGLAPDVTPCRLLLVDDSPTNRLVLRRMLTPLGLDLVEAADGQQAIDQWQQTQPDAVLMDLQMPGLDGRAAMRQIRSRPGGDRVKLIAVTAGRATDPQNQGLGELWDDVLHKPVEKVELLRLLAQHLGLRYRYGEVEESEESVKE